MRRIVFVCFLATLTTGCFARGDDDGGDGGSTAGSAVQFCQQGANEICRRAFGDCDTELGFLAERYADELACRADSDCDPEQFLGQRFDAVAANTCLAEVRTMACEQWLSELPFVCETVLTPEPPSRAGCTRVGAGTFTGTLATTDPVLEFWGHYDAYCLQLTAGRTVVIDTSAGAVTPVEDTVLTLFDAGDRLVAENDDNLTGLYSHLEYTVQTTGEHFLAVSGFDESELGSYTLTIQIQ